MVPAGEHDVLEKHRTLLGDERDVGTPFPLCDVLHEGQRLAIGPVGVGHCLGDDLVHDDLEYKRERVPRRNRCRPGGSRACSRTLRGPSSGRCPVLPSGSAGRL